MSEGDRAFERALIQRLCARDEEAFSEIVQLYGDRVFNLVLRMVGHRSEAEDIAQEVFVTVFKHIESFRAESRFSTWLLRIAANHARNRIKYLSLRKQRASDLESLENAHENTTLSHNLHSNRRGPEQTAVANQMSRVLAAAIDSLEEDQRLLITLRDIEEMAYDEIREITGLPIGTVKSRLHRARMALKAKLSEEQP